MRIILALAVWLAAFPAIAQFGPAPGLPLSGGALTGNTTLRGMPLSAVPSSTARFPNTQDGTAAGYTNSSSLGTQSWWLGPDGKALLLQQSTAGYADWQPRINVASVMTDFDGNLPCDIGTVVLCAFTRVMKKGYTGNLITVMNGATGVATDIGSVNGALDTASLDFACLNANRCYVTGVWNQMTSTKLLTAAMGWMATNASNTAGAALNFASTAAMTTGQYVDVNSANCVMLSLTSKTSTTAVLQTYDGPVAPCAAASGVGVSFGNAPVITAQNTMGNSRNIVADHVWDSRSAGRQELIIDATITFASNNHTVMFPGAFQNAIQGAGYALWSAGAGSNGESMACNNGNCAVTHANSNNTTWATSFAQGAWLTRTPQIYWVQSSGTAFTAGMGEVSPIPANQTVGNQTLTGGTFLGRQVSTDTPNYNGGMESPGILIASPADTSLQFSQRYAAMMQALALPTQQRDPYVLVTGAEALQSTSVENNMQEYLRMMQVRQPSWRTASMFGTTMPNVGMSGFCNAFGSRVQITLSGTTGVGSSVTVTFTNAALAGSPVAVLYNEVVGDTTPTIAATNLAAAINANSTVTGAGVFASASGPVVTVYYRFDFASFVAASGVTTGVAVGSVGGNNTNYVQSAVRTGPSNYVQIAAPWTNDYGQPATTTGLQQGCIQAYWAQTAPSLMVTLLHPFASNYYGVSLTYMTNLYAWVRANHPNDSRHVLVDMTADPAFATGWDNDRTNTQSGFDLRAPAFAHIAEAVERAIASRIKPVQ